MKPKTSILSKLSLRRLGAKQYLIIALVAVGLVTAGLAYTRQPEGSKTMGAELAHTEGTVEYRLSDSDAWQAAAVDLPVKQGMTVRAGSDGRAIINLDDGSAVRLNSSSSVKLSQLTFQRVLVENKGGQVYTRVTKSDSRIFEVQTSKSTYRSMGTAYRTIDTPEKEGVEVYHSKVNIIGATQDGVIVEQGERYYQVFKDAPDQASKVAEIDRAAIAEDDFIAWNSEEDRKEFESELGVLFDLTPPALEVSSPANGSATTADKVDVKGTTEAGAKILVDGQTATNTAGSFSLSVELNLGPNAIKVEAEDGAGNKTVKTVTVTRTAAPASPTPPPAAAKVFRLYGTKVDGGISFSWGVSGYDVSKGFKLLRSNSANPTYEGKSDKVFLDSGARAYTWKIKDGQAHHFRICTYNGSSCATYSNNVTVTAPAKPASPSPSGSVTLSAGSGGNVSWVLAGSAPNGYKLVWNTTGNPVYPGDSAAFHGASATSGSISGSPGTYYVRVCMYKDGACPIYSNQVQVTLP